MSAQFDLTFVAKPAQSTKPKSLVVLLHGVGGNETHLVDFADALGPDTLAIMPRGPLTLGAGQYAWFRVNFTSTGPVINPVEAEQSRQTLVQFVQQLQSAYGIAPEKTVIAGFSQGGILSASVGLSAPALVAGFGILSGRILPELAPHIADKSKLKQLRAFIGHGQFDNKLPVEWAQRAEQILADLGLTYTARRYPMGHEISAAMHADFVAWAGSITAGV